MFGKKKKKKAPLLIRYSEQIYQESSPEPDHVCKICGREYVSTDSCRSYAACDACNVIYKRDQWDVPASFKSVARSYQGDFDCYAEYKAILGAYSDRIITLEARNQKIAELVTKYENKEKEENARRQAREEKERKARAENKQRVYDMFGI